MFAYGKHGRTRTDVRFSCRVADWRFAGRLEFDPVSIPYAMRLSTCRQPFVGAFGRRGVVVPCRGGCGRSARWLAWA